MQGKSVALFKPMSTEFLEEFSPRGERPLGSSSCLSFFGNIVGDRVLDSRETTGHWVPSLFRFRARMHGGSLSGRRFEGWWQPAVPKQLW